MTVWECKHLCANLAERLGSTLLIQRSLEIGTTEQVSLTKVPIKRLTLVLAYEQKG